MYRMEREPEMQKAVDELFKSTTGKTLTESQDTKVCSFCGKPATKFKDKLSKKEYGISGMCQDCQDGFFVETDNSEEGSYYEDVDEVPW